MKSREIIRRLEKEGWVKVHQIGSHAKYKHLQIPGSVTVPHPRKDIPIGTVRAIYRQAGWQWP
jgi:predicted RNA binding protein YcfA (HicA-like mRNA interferase family)